MRAVLAGLAFLSFSLTLLPAPAADKADGQKSSSLAFATQELERGLDIGYAVLLVDVNGDGKTDIVVVDTHRVVWYANPTWKRHTIIEGLTMRDNVCIAAHDIDGDGKLDFALGAGWKPFNTKSGGTLQWLKQPASPDQPWKVYPIGDEPMLHRIRFADLDGSGKPVLIAVPLMGRNATAGKNWMDGSPVRVLAYRIPKDPVRDRWVPEVIDESQHVVHNFYPVAGTGKGMDVLTASYEGVHLLAKDSGKWTRRKLGSGNQDKPTGSRGASEIKKGTLGAGRPFIATVEPWHGHQVVVYTPPEREGELWQRHVIDEQLRWGHAVWCADLDGDGKDELVIGVRDDLGKGPGQRRGVRIYKCLDGAGKRWQRHLIDEGGVAVEDLACADLDGDGKIDIVAVGRQTKNVRLYRNVGKR